MSSPAARPVPPLKRLLLATTAAVLCQLLLSGLQWLLPYSGGLASAATAIDCAIVLLAMALGGWIGGMRFLPIALLLTLLVWGSSLVALAQAGLPLREAPFSQNLLGSLRYNALAISANLVAAALGCVLGGWLARRKPLRLPG